MSVATAPAIPPAASTSRLVALVRAQSPADAREAGAIAAHLRREGFEPRDLDELVEGVAATVCAEADPAGVWSPGHRRQRQQAETTAAQELGESLDAQVQLLLAWHAREVSPSASFREKLATDLCLDRGATGRLLAA